MLKTIGAALLTAVVTSMFWIWYFNFNGVPTREPDGRLSPRGDVVAVGSPAGPVAVAEGVEVGPAGLAIPVAGIKGAQLSDTFTQARAGGARRHDAIDIMAAEGTPVVAAADGQVEKLFNSAAGGLTLYVRSPDRRWTYYYAHLQRYEPGLAEGQQVKRGQRLGLVGHTGNANPAGPHLHFAINQMQPGEKWWHGAPVNPYPLLAGKKVRG
jgi:murein DD-endopeptidase MepM/ murein hydrolase activator NlpD